MPALVVAIAGNPASANRRALAASQAFGSTSMRGPACSARNACALSADCSRLIVDGPFYSRSVLVGSRSRIALRVAAILGVLLLASAVASPFGPSAPISGRQTECVSRPAAPPPTPYAAVVARARAIACARLADHIPGLAVAVAVDGRIVWSEAFGYADLDAKTPATPATQFRIGSVSKPLTAAAVAQLYEQGKLDLDAPVQRYVPSFPDKGYPITTRQLAGHLAGIRNYRGDEPLLNRHFDSVRDGLAIFEHDS